MRTILMLCLIVLTTGCTKDDNPVDESTKEIAMNFYAYTKYDPAGTSFKAKARFFLFDAANGERFKEERIEIPFGSYSDFSKASSKMITLLKNNQYELENGTRVKPIVIDGDYYISISTDINNQDKWASYSQNTVKIPLGKYFVVALIVDPGGLGYYDKYSGKYIEVEEDMAKSDKTIEITFPHDFKHKGFIDWVTINW